jgi:hypothetical protein
MLSNMASQKKNPCPSLPVQELAKAYGIKGIPQCSRAPEVSPVVSVRLHAFDLGKSYPEPRPLLIRPLQGKDLASHPLLPSLQSCESPEDVLTVLREQVPAFSQSQSSDDRLTKWVTPTVNVLHSFSETIGQVVGLVNTKTFLHRKLGL